jgi:hypothetical protein
MALSGADDDMDTIYLNGFVPQESCSLCPPRSASGCDLSVLTPVLLLLLCGCSWVAVFQLLFTLPSALPSAFIQQLPVSQLPANFADGWK